MLDLVTSLATHGTPSYTDHADGLNTPLEQMTSDHGLERYFNISSDASLVTDEKLREELQFWNKVRNATFLQHLTFFTRSWKSPEIEIWWTAYPQLFTGKLLAKDYKES